MEYLTLDMLRTMIVPLTTAAVELIKKIPNLKHDYLPYISVVVAMLMTSALYFMSVNTNEEIVVMLFNGLFSGFAASGLYSTVKAGATVVKRNVD